MKMSWRDRLRPASRRPMTCGEVGQWLQHYLDGELDERRSGRLAAHLEDCKRCGLEADVYDQIRRSLVGHRAEVPAESIARLREFGARIARGETPVQP